MSPTLRPLDTAIGLERLAVGLAYGRLSVCIANTRSMVDSCQWTMAPFLNTLDTTLHQRSLEE